MSADTDDTVVLEKRATQLGLARTEALDAKQTITHRTFAASEDLTLPAPSSSPHDTSELPKISIDDRAINPGSLPPLASRADYALVATIGEGGMGRVHLARQRSLGRDVALKTLKPDAAPAVANALLREARLTGSLEHPGVIPVHALGVDERARPMLVMKRVDGVDLETLLADPAHDAWRSRGADRLVACVEILIQVCRTLELAHSRGVIHRDIKPANVMIGGFGEVYLLDWGIARRKEDPPEDDALVGTPVYMAPEMVRGGTVDARTDVYLLGATLHEMLTNRSRHEGKTISDVIKAAIRSAPFAYGASVPEELADLCNRATARDPAHRPPTAEAFREELGDFLRHRSARALCDIAIDRVAELASLLETANAAAPKDLVRAYRLATEARFGLTESLRSNAKDAVARDAMRRCLTASVELEIRQEHADSAAAILGEMEAPDPELTKRIAEVRERDAVRVRDRARLAAIEHDMDPSVVANQRTRPLLALLLVPVGFGVFFAFANMTPTPLGVAVIAASALLLIVVALVVLRRRVLTNAFNRRISGVLLVASVAMVLNRSFGAYVDRPVPQTLAIDLFLYAILIATAAITLLRRFWIASAVTFAGAVVSALVPRNAVALFVPTLTLALITCIVILARARRADG